MMWDWLHRIVRLVARLVCDHIKVTYHYIRSIARPDVASQDLSPDCLQLVAASRATKLGEPRLIARPAAASQSQSQPVMQSVVRQHDQSYVPMIIHNRPRLSVPPATVVEPRVTPVQRSLQDRCRFLNMVEDLPATDFDRKTVHDR